MPGPSDPGPCSIPSLLALLTASVILFPCAAWAVCGDGILDAGEACDDLNATSLDGCDSSCQTETGWDCIEASFDLDFDETLIDDSTHSNPNWSISNGNLTVTQSENSDPAVYVSTLPAMGVTISFELTVNTTQDDDFIGWVVGYESGDNLSPTADWILFDWKQTSQTLGGWGGGGGAGAYGAEGLRMYRVTGAILDRDDMWGHQGSVAEIALAGDFGTTPGAEICSDNIDNDGDCPPGTDDNNDGTACGTGDYGVDCEDSDCAALLGCTGWVDLVTYTIEISYSTTEVEVWVDGALEFSETGAFPTGNFGFYNYSQANIEYELVAPIDQSICSMLDSDLDGIVDLDEFILGTNEFDPDSDGDGVGDLAEVVDVFDALNTDGDTLINALDADDDGDGVDTVDEDLNANGVPTDDDTDGDSIPNFLDLDDDGDGILSSNEDPDGDGNPANDDTDGDGTPNYLDLDSDGDGSNDDVDCEPLNNQISPLATEVCDGIDQNCNGQIDEGVLPPTWYRDVDGDGFGNLVDTAAACIAPAGYIADSTDCDDLDNQIYPGATELCNNQDDDCNGLSDATNPTTGIVGEVDLDGDLSLSCADCDDALPTNTPGAPELCDGLDNDCNGLSDFDALGEVDADGDGSVSCADCDDADPANFPDNVEACDGADNDCNGTADFHPIYGEFDLDNDSVLGCGGQCLDANGALVCDCNDANPFIYPGNVEVCDNLDNDCDGLVDEPDATDASTWYRDEDEDNYGSPEVSTVACVPPAGYIADNQDCDDQDADINPLGIEVCDGADNDCNDAVDEPSALDSTTWYLDADGDDYGDPKISTLSCFQPTGYVDENTDCDDSNDDVNPGMDEVWYDGIDQDCDGNDDDKDSDGHNHEVDCNDEDATINPGMDEIWYDGIDQDCDGNDDDQDRDEFPVEDDCDDENAEINPAAVEVWYDGIDQDCDGNDDDQDRDGFPEAEDCDDTDPDLSWRCASDGCNCSAAAADPSESLSLMGLLLMAGLVRRRRRS